MSYAGARTTPQTIADVGRTLAFGEFLMQALAAFRADRVRATMTALGMVIGTSSLILVVTIALSGKQYVLAQIEDFIFSPPNGSGALRSKVAVLPTRKLSGQPRTDV